MAISGSTVVVGTPDESSSTGAAYVFVLPSQQAGTFDGGVFRSTDAGGSRRTVATGLPDKYVGDVAVDPVHPGVVYASVSYLGPPGDGVFRSMDGGGHWSANVLRSCEDLAKRGRGPVFGSTRVVAVCLEPPADFW